MGRGCFLRSFAGRSVPSELSKVCPHLKELDLSENEIADVSCVVKLTELDYLDLTGNKQLTVLPVELFTVTLKTLLLDLDIVTDPPPHIVTKGVGFLTR